jgi:hypothetical protein
VTLGPAARTAHVGRHPGPVITKGTAKEPAMRLAICLLIGTNLWTGCLCWLYAKEAKYANKKADQFERHVIILRKALTHVGIFGGGDK